jgi:hypothetical protein
MGAVKELEILLSNLERLRRQRYPELEGQVAELIKKYSNLPKREVAFYHERTPHALAGRFDPDLNKKVLLIR